MMLNKLFMSCQFKEVGDEMSFTAYGNVKNVKDNVGDVAVDGCYKESIEIHKQKGTMPKLLWGHDYRLPPVGAIKNWEEDSKGLLFEGKLAKTERGKELHVLAKEGALDSFSIGYLTLDEKWDEIEKVNLLKSVHVKEISFVNFACNEDSLLQDIKSQISNGELPTERDIERALRTIGLSRKEALKIASAYKPKKLDIDLSILKKYDLFN